MARLSVENSAVAENDAGTAIDEFLPLPPTKTPDYIERNREAWERWAHTSAVAGGKAWHDEELKWGLWSTPEAQLQLLQELESGGDVVELGCGTAAVSAGLTRMGARPVAVDFSRRQLRTAERLQYEFGLAFPLICANAEEVPFEEASFEIAISEYGASLWCDPRRWLPEARRLLRRDGRLIFFTNSAFLLVCTPTNGAMAEERLTRDYFSTYRVEFPGEGAVEFHPRHGQWIRLLRGNGFILENLIEVQPPKGAEARFSFASLEWAQRWPSEEIWVARKK